MNDRLVEASALIAGEPPDQVDFLHSVLAQCGLPHRNPGDVRTWDRRQGMVSLRIEAGAAIDPSTGKFTELGLPYGEKPRLVLIHLSSEAIRTGSPVVEVEDSLTAFVRSLELDGRPHPPHPEGSARAPGGRHDPARHGRGRPRGAGQHPDRGRAGPVGAD
jgi:hypothetical protein